MPDIYTKRPDIVSSVLKDAGFENPTQPKIFTQRTPEQTYRFGGKDSFTEIYVHNIREIGFLRANFPDFILVGLGFILGVVVCFVLRKRSASS